MPTTNCRLPPIAPTRSRVHRYEDAQKDSIRVLTSLSPMEIAQFKPRNSASVVRVNRQLDVVIARCSVAQIVRLDPLIIEQPSCLGAILEDLVNNSDHQLVTQGSNRNC